MRHSLQQQLTRAGFSKNGLMVEEYILNLHLMKRKRQIQHLDMVLKRLFLLYSFFSPPLPPPRCYLSFSRSRGEPGPNRNQLPVAHVCALKTWREIKGIWQALCLIHNIISNISMSQTAPVKQRLMIQTHKTHTAGEWEVKMARQRRQMPFEALVLDSFPQAEAAGKTFYLFFPDPFYSSAQRVLRYTLQNCISVHLPAEVSDWCVSQQHSVLHFETESFIIIIQRSATSHDVLCFCVCQHVLF